MNKLCPGVGAVNACGFILFRRDALQCRQQGHGKERDAEPDIRDDCTPQGSTGIGQHMQGFGTQPRPHEEVRNRPQVGVEQPLPGETTEERRYGPGQEHDALVQRPARERLGEQECQPQAQDELKK
jgi:hypothetical protein